MMPRNNDANPPIAMRPPDSGNSHNDAMAIEDIPGNLVQSCRPSEPVGGIFHASAAAFVAAYSD